MSEQVTADAAPDEGWDWSIVEIFGHRRHVGRIREEERFGTRMLRIDVPKVDYETREITGFASHYYGGGSIFSITPTNEASAITANRGYPPFRSALPAPSETDEQNASTDDEDEDETDDEHA